MQPGPDILISMLPMGLSCAAWALTTMVTWCSSQLVPAISRFLPVLLTSKLTEVSLIRACSFIILVRSKASAFLPSIMMVWRASTSISMTEVLPPRVLSMRIL